MSGCRRSRPRHRGRMARHVLLLLLGHPPAQHQLSQDPLSPRLRHLPLLLRATGLQGCRFPAGAADRRAPRLLALLSPALHHPSAQRAHARVRSFQSDCSRGPSCWLPAGACRGRDGEEPGLSQLLLSLHPGRSCCPRLRAPSGQPRPQRAGGAGACPRLSPRHVCGSYRESDDEVLHEQRDPPGRRDRRQLPGQLQRLHHGLPPRPPRPQRHQLLTRIAR
mmetsp:Transcript_2333/g.5454  ORF Transcript_2333/g.5454 Transcript_2333/m.5454 type:complete len:221 (+) Transcript_2333:2993-3655(+)